MNETNNSTASTTALPFLLLTIIYLLIKCKRLVKKLFEYENKLKLTQKEASELKSSLQLSENEIIKCNRDLITSKNVINELNKGYGSIFDMKKYKV